MVISAQGEDPISGRDVVLDVVFEPCIHGQSACEMTLRRQDKRTRRQLRLELEDAPVHVKCTDDAELNMGKLVGRLQSWDIARGDTKQPKL